MRTPTCTSSAWPARSSVLASQTQTYAGTQTCACPHKLCVTPSWAQAYPKIMSNAPHPSLKHTHTLPPPAVPASSEFTLGRPWRCHATWDPFCSLSTPWAGNTHLCVLRVCVIVCVCARAHPHTLGCRRSKEHLPPTQYTPTPFYAFLDCAHRKRFPAASQQPTAKCHFPFDSLICIGSPSQRDSGYQCP